MRLKEGIYEWDVLFTNNKTRSLQTIKHVEKGVPIDKMQTPTDGMSCLAQVQRQMMDIPLQRTIKVQS